MAIPPGDPLRRLDDPDYPALTTSQAADVLGVQAAFLRSLDTSGVLQPHRSPGGHRRYSRHQLAVAARVRGLLDDGHPLASAELILALQDDLADARADTDRLRTAVDRLHEDTARLREDTARLREDTARLRDERDRARRGGAPLPDDGHAAT